MSISSPIRAEPSSLQALRSLPQDEAAGVRKDLARHLNVVKRWAWLRSKPKKVAQRVREGSSHSTAAHDHNEAHCELQDDFFATKPHRSMANIIRRSQQAEAAAAVSLSPESPAFVRLPRAMRSLSRTSIRTPTHPKPVPALQPNGDTCEYVVDCLWECQRGAVMFGMPTFSAAALLNFDPATWVDTHMTNSPFNRHTFPLPSPEWRWLDPAFFINMALDSDEQGWTYAFSFWSKTGWRGTSKTWRSFVRRRQWIRTRIKQPIQIPLSVDRPLSQSRRANSEFEQRPTPLTPFDKDRTNLKDIENALALTPAHATLPLDECEKIEIMSNETCLDANDPFLAWHRIRFDGDRLLKRRAVGDFEGRSDEDLLHVWRDAVIEINYHRIMRVLGHCRVDRERVRLWRHWLAVDADADGDDDRTERPEFEDVWDLIEARLDELLQGFHYQTSREAFLILVHNLHAVQHRQHRYELWDHSSVSNPQSILAEPNRAEYFQHPTAPGPRVQFSEPARRDASYYTAFGSTDDQQDDD